jgi:hypothetical protein
VDTLSCGFEVDKLSCGFEVDKLFRGIEVDKSCSREDGVSLSGAGKAIDDDVTALPWFVDEVG